LPRGKTASVLDLNCSVDDARRLRELGILEGRFLEVLRAGDPLICRVGASRLGMCGPLAMQIGIDDGSPPRP
jgi:Fe2+ transport system protein FeoA